MPRSVATRVCDKAPGKSLVVGGKVGEATYIARVDHKVSAVSRIRLGSPLFRSSENIASVPLNGWRVPRASQFR